MRGRLCGAQCGQLARDLIRAGHALLAMLGLDGKLLPNERDRPARLQDCTFDFSQRREPLLVRGCFQLGRCDHLLLHPLGLDQAVLDERVRCVLDQFLDLVMVLAA